MTDLPVIAHVLLECLGDGSALVAFDHRWPGVEGVPDFIADGTKDLLVLRVGLALSPPVECYSMPDKLTMRGVSFNNVSYTVVVPWAAVAGVNGFGVAYRRVLDPRPAVVETPKPRGLRSV